MNSFKVKTILVLLVILVGAVLIRGTLEKNYQTNITSCADLAEQACFTTSSCEGIYAAGNNNISFQNCVDISEDVKRSYTQDSGTCQQSGGSWQVTKLGQSCDCSTARGSRFVKGQGCV
ncbi:hypothetical protein CL634_08535 [bacterium]|nr:hypothetical protein [bacterium]|tara:strand:+ start:617 stop:973 length:357 start_codon:yes stop_codon:yes gene_type:complete